MSDINARYSFMGLQLTAGQLLTVAKWLKANITDKSPEEWVPDIQVDVETSQTYVGLSYSLIIMKTMELASGILVDLGVDDEVVGVEINK